MFISRNQDSRKQSALSPFYLFDELIDLSQSNISDYTLTRDNESIKFKTTAIGLEKSDIEMSINDRNLVVKSNKDVVDTFSKKLSYNIPIKHDIVKDEITANLNLGILEINMPINNTNNFNINF